MFFPYRAQIRLYRLPVITLLVSLLCIAVYAAQLANERALFQSAVDFCEQEHEPGFRKALLKLSGQADVRTCLETLLGIHLARDRNAQIADLARRIGAVEGMAHGDLSAYYREVLSETYRDFDRRAPAYLTARLWYPPESWNVPRMLSASVAHGSVLHLLGNLIFFFAFGAAIEALLGPILYTGVLLALALGTHAVYSVVQADALPTLGLSGVIMGVMALFVYFMPTAKIRCLLWLVVFFRRFGLPAWLLVTWYVGWDAYAQLTSQGDPQINLVAHLSGAAIGLTLGITFFRRKRHWAQELVEQ